MTARNPLFEFMPYGAPELLAAQRSHLLRALVLASGLALVTFMFAHALGLSFPPAPPIRIELPGPGVSLYTPPSIRVQEPVTPKFTLPAKAAKAGVIEPVRDDAAPQAQSVVTPGEGRPGGVDGGTPQPARDAPAGPGTGVEDPLPELDKYYYVDELPAAAKIVEPVYPDIAKEAGVEGRVYVHMLVGKDGRVMRAEIDPKFSVLMLDSAALAAAREWVFKPALVNQHPVPVWVGQMFVFTLHR